MSASLVSGAFLTGVLTGAGPCAGTRAATLVALLGGARGPARWVRCAAFGAGLCAASITLVSLAGGLRVAVVWSTYAYAGLAMVSLAAGLTMLVRDPRYCCARLPGRTRAAGVGTAIVAGFASAAVGSSCCGPIGLLLLGVTGAGAGSTAAIAAAFAAGHLLAPVAIALGWRVACERVARLMPAGSGATIGGALGVGCALYYGVLA